MGLKASCSSMDKAVALALVGPSVPHPDSHGVAWFVLKTAAALKQLHCGSFLQLRCMCTYVLTLMAPTKLHCCCATPPSALQLFKLLCDQAAAGGPLAGALAWMWADPSYPDYDGYTLYPGGCPAPEAAGAGVQPCVADPGSTEALAALVAFLQGLVPRPTPS